MPISATGENKPTQGGGTKGATKGFYDLDFDDATKSSARSVLELRFACLVLLFSCVLKNGCMRHRLAKATPTPSLRQTSEQMRQATEHPSRTCLFVGRLRRRFHRRGGRGTRLSSSRRHAELCTRHRRWYTSPLCATACCSGAQLKVAQWRLRPPVRPTCGGGCRTPSTSPV